jgi:hypothetical protein
MRPRALIVVVLLAVWVIWGSVAVAFDDCAMMGPLCEAPCGLGVPGLPGTLPTLPRPMPAIQTALLAQHAPAVTPHALDPVPRSGRLSA